MIEVKYNYLIYKSQNSYCIDGIFTHYEIKKIKNNCFQVLIFNHKLELLKIEIYTTFMKCYNFIVKHNTDMIFSSFYNEIPCLSKRFIPKSILFQRLYTLYIKYFNFIVV